MDPQKLIEQFLGPNALGQIGGVAQRAKDSFLGGNASGATGASPWGQGGRAPAQNEAQGQSFLGGLGAGLPGGAMGGMAAGGLVALLLGSKSVRKMAGPLLSHGGAAALGALAHRAWMNYQAGQQATAAPPATAADIPSENSRFLPRTAADGQPFALALVQAMIAAANADGHIGPDEHRRIAEAAQKAGLDAEQKAFVFDALSNPPTPRQIAAMANGPEQASELYLAARIAIDPDLPQERAFMQDLAANLNLPAGLVAHLESQIAVPA